MANSVVRMTFTDERPAAGATEMVVHADSMPAPSIADGSITSAKLASGVLPGAAAANKSGLVKQAAALAKVTAADAAAAAGDAPTKEEFDKLVALANATKAALNGNADKSKAAGQSA